MSALVTIAILGGYLALLYLLVRHQKRLEEARLSAEQAKNVLDTLDPAVRERILALQEDIERAFFSGYIETPDQGELQGITERLIQVTLDPPADRVQIRLVLKPYGFPDGRIRRGPTPIRKVRF